MQLHIKPLSPETVEDFFTFFDKVAFADHPEWGCGCYCCMFHAPDTAAWADNTPETNAQLAREMILRGEMRGLLAYDGERPVGWCHCDLLGNIPVTRAYCPAVASEDDSTGAIVCFTVAQGYRGQGVATRLLHAALDALRAQGAQVAEAYLDLNAQDAEHHYHGPLTMYEKAGFTLVRSHGDMGLVRRAL
jgi:GNAT superfamily N-acetyltransferase